MTHWSNITLCSSHFTGLTSTDMMTMYMYRSVGEFAALAITENMLIQWCLAIAELIVMDFAP
ncbi:hypothetical protein E2C01_012698 [Portunus trituberculatus]|uniref:Uncharacterized protein n=1 Tax=Portunus trituberculatus TaxID=210409 RepID=A0A5B7DEE2_PORTR|nr:hypothetical protein [Portunus trituberculatus]